MVMAGCLLNSVHGIAITNEQHRHLRCAVIGSGYVIEITFSVLRQWNVANDLKWFYR